MSERTKTQYIQLLAKIADARGPIPTKGLTITDCGQDVEISELTVDGGEVGIATADWFYPLEELTKKELIAVHKTVR